MKMVYLIVIVLISMISSQPIYAKSQFISIGTDLIAANNDIQNTIVEIGLGNKLSLAATLPLYTRSEISEGSYYAWPRYVWYFDFETVDIFINIYRKHTFKGFYIGPYLELATMNVTLRSTYVQVPEMIPIYYYYTQLQNINSTGLQLGYKINISKNICLDLKAAIINVPEITIEFNEVIGMGGFVQDTVGHTIPSTSVTGVGAVFSIVL